MLKGLSVSSNVEPSSIDLLKVYAAWNCRPCEKRFAASFRVGGGVGDGVFGKDVGEDRDAIDRATGAGRERWARRITVREEYGRRPTRLSAGFPTVLCH